MFSNAKLNLVVDAVILMAFLAATISGLVLLTMPHAGYEGGRNPYYGQAVLFLTRDGWNDVHVWVWGSLAMIVGIAVHVVLHWRWIVCMVKRFARLDERGALPGSLQLVPVVVTERED